MKRSTDRRTLLQSIAVGAGGTVSGCSGLGSVSSDPSQTTQRNSSGSSNATPRTNSVKCSERELHKPKPTTSPDSSISPRSYPDLPDGSSVSSYVGFLKNYEESFTYNSFLDDNSVTDVSESKLSELKVGVTNPTEPEAYESGYIVGLRVNLSYSRGNEEADTVFDVAYFVSPNVIRRFRTPLDNVGLVKDHGDIMYCSALM